MLSRLFRSFVSGGTKPLFETATLSAPGGRAANEDAVGYRTGCWALADGLGGHRGGEIASRLAVDAVLASFEENTEICEAALNAHFEKANRAVLDRQAAEPELAHMRTTAVVLLASPEKAIWVHAGDSRLYWLRDGAIREQTKDHSVPQRLADAGEISADQIPCHEDRSRLLNSVGAREQVVASHGAAETLPGDAFLLASDGFWEGAMEREMEEDSHAASCEAWLEKMEARVKAGAGSDHDNYSAIAVRVLAK